ncbi:MAG: DUF3108 domain-containing protein [Flavobacteriaceae bacterium]|nr:DUF3108 domain-containing protein [Flavobacteriaceae bacterium]
MKFKILFIFLFLHLIVLGQAQSFKEGEVLKFKIKYGWFKASEASLSVAKAELRGQPMYHILAEGKSTGMLDVFFRVRNRYESYVGLQDGLSHRFIRKTSEGGHKKDKMIDFFQDQQLAVVNDYKRDTVSNHSLEGYAQDMISAYYHLREIVDIQDIEQGDEFILNMFFDEENYPFKAKYMGDEILKTDFGTIKAMVFKPFVQADRVFKEKESVTIWISKDKNKIPLKMEAKLAVGSLNAHLYEYRGLANPFNMIFEN